MPRPQRRVDSVETRDGLLELRQRGDRDFMILIDSRVLMTSFINTSELFLAEAGCKMIQSTKAPRVLIGGLGLGFTLRAALDNLPKDAVVVVAELTPQVIQWCRGPVAMANGGAALDPRVSFVEGDVTAHIAEVAQSPEQRRYDAVLWDLYVGPTRSGGDADPLYGDRSVKRAAAALTTSGVFGVWGETPSPAFEARLRRFGLSPECHRVGNGGLKHAVYLARKLAKERVTPRDC